MKRQSWIWYLVFIAGIWFIANGIVGFRPVQIQIYRVGFLTIPAWQRYLLYTFLYSLQFLGVWGVVAGAGLFLRKDFFRKLAVAFCCANIALVCFSITLDASRILYLGSPIEIPEQYRIPYSALGKVMSAIYTVLILVLLTRSATIKLFQGVSSQPTSGTKQ